MRPRGAATGWDPEPRAREDPQCSARGAGALRGPRACLSPGRGQRVKRSRPAQRPQRLPAALFLGTQAGGLRVPIGAPDGSGLRRSLARLRAGVMPHCGRARRTAPVAGFRRTAPVEAVSTAGSMSAQARISTAAARSYSAGTPARIQKPADGAFSALIVEGADLDREGATRPAIRRIRPSTRVRNGFEQFVAHRAAAACRVAAARGSATVRPPAAYGGRCPDRAGRGRWQAVLKSHRVGHEAAR